ncbi:LiaF-related protein, partial [Cellulomonas fimi]
FAGTPFVDVGVKKAVHDAPGVIAAAIAAVESGVPAPAATGHADPWVKQPAPARATAATSAPATPSTSAPLHNAPTGPTPGAPVAGPAPYGPYGPYPAPGTPGPYRSGPTPPVPPAPQLPLVPPPPPAPRKPRVLGPGVGMVGSVVALSLIGLAVLLLAERTGDFDGPVALTALGIGIVLAGLGIIVSGLRGRRSGALGALAIVGILVALPVGAAQTTDWVWTSGSHRQLDGGTYVVDSRRAAADGFDLGFGDALVDLTAVPLTSSTLDVPVSLGAGNLTVVVPADAAVAADVEAGVGTVRWELDGETRTVDGLGISEQTFEDEQTRNGTTAQLDLHVSVGAGEVRIIEEQA